MRVHGIPQRKGSEPQDRPPLQVPTASPADHLGFRPTGCQSDVSTSSSWGSINLLWRLTEHWKPIGSLGYYFITKDIKGLSQQSGEARDTQSEALGKGVAALLEAGA